MLVMSGLRRMKGWMIVVDVDVDVYYYIRWRLKLEGETENMGVCTKERKGLKAEVLMAIPCTKLRSGINTASSHIGQYDTG